MRKLPVLFLCILLYLAGHSQVQQIVLFSENFETDTSGNADFIFNTDTGGAAPGHGNNNWTVNAQYNGNPLYPNTPNEDSTANGGIIYLAPYSHYLHIHDKTAVASGVANDNWNTTSASDQFCYLSESFCTLGLTDVIFTFFWICQGDSNAYGQVYYSANGGAWRPTGRNKYNNQSDWIYETIQDPAFNNLQNLQFGFRWVNPVSSDSSDVAFGIDDIIAVGNYDSINSPTTITMVADTAADTVICQGDPIYFSLYFSGALCDGDYDLQMSDASGSFAPQHYIDLGTYTLGSDNAIIDLPTAPTPTSLTGSCFKFRVVRETPPIIVTDTFECIKIIKCPVTIFNVNVPVLTDQDTACILSEIDVFFNSTGNFQPGNDYIAELSDSTGSFTDSTYLGKLPSAASYPVMPGDVTGLIPAGVPPACGYYIRVRSTNPPAIGPTFGPYCLTQCDELTNNHTDIKLCISSGPYPACDDSLLIQPHDWPDSAQYDTCNNWTVQVLNMNPFFVVNTGFFGVFHDSLGGYYKICAPSTADSLPFAPGMYYMRIISSCSNETWNETGTIVRITVGAPQTTPPVITVLGDTSFCQNASAEVQLYVSPFNSPPSNYYWTSNLLNNGDPFTWMYDPLNITLNNSVTPGTYKFYVQENNYGCVGPISAPAQITIVGPPVDTISGPPQICVGDTATFHISFLPNTHWSWKGGNLLDSSDVQLQTYFETTGSFQLACTSTNSCQESSTVYFPVKVIKPFSIDIAPGDTTICAGQPLTLGVETGLDQRTLFTDQNGNITKPGGMFNLVTHADVTIDSIAVRYANGGPVTALVFGKNGSFLGYEQNSAAWSKLGQATFIAKQNKMNVIPTELNLPIQQGDSFAFYVTANSGSFNSYFTQGVGIETGVVYNSDGIIDFEQGTWNLYPFGSYVGPYVLDAEIFYTTRAGLNYIWSNGDSGQVIRLNPVQSGSYSAFVYDTIGCSNETTISVTVDTIPSVYAGPDTTVCPDSNYVMIATASAPNLLWQPGRGLSDSTILTPTFNYADTMLYVLSATGANGCAGRDTVQISVIKVLLNLPPLPPICSDSTVTIAASSSASQIVWSPAEGLNRTDTINPVFKYTQSITYQVTATELGCNITDSLHIDVEYCLSHLVAPKAFAPNGNGMNENFTVYGDNIETYEIKIFNRWGEEVYYSNDVSELNQPGRGWNGTYKGKLQDAGSFAYYITAKDITGKTIQLKGNLILIR